MYLRTCILLLCLGCFHILATLLTNATDNSSDTLDSRMRDEYKRIYLHNEVGESSRSVGNDSDGKVEIAGPSKSDQVRYFNPVEQFWQYEQCRQLDVQLEKYFQFNQAVKILNSPLRWVEVTADGNGFYRALSYWVSGTEKHYDIIRQRVLDVVRTDQRIMNFLGETNYRAHLLWISQYTWATKLEIVASTLLLKTSIYVYSHQEQTWGFYDYNKVSKDTLPKSDKCIYIQHTSGVHYNLVTDVKSKQDRGFILSPKKADNLDRDMQNPLPIGKSQPEKITYFYPVDEAWQHDKSLKWNLIVEEPFQYIQVPTIINTPKKCVKMQNDKNCFFRAISYWMTGTDINHQIIRKHVAEEILFNYAIQKLYKENEFTSFKTRNNRATEIEIVASAVLLNTSIFIYSHVTQAWDIYNKNIIDKVPVNTSTDKCIYLRQMYPSEYDVVQEVEINNLF